MRQAVIATNRPLLRQARSSFLHQIECAIDRHDPVSVHHRTTALLASYFDVLFALNRVLHPGEKRLLAMARDECPRLPPDFETLVGNLINATALPWSDGRLLASAHALIDGLDDLFAPSARSELRPVSAGGASRWIERSRQWPWRHARRLHCDRWPAPPY